MADFAWIPTYTFKHKTTFKTDVTKFSSGVTQRRSLWPTPDYEFRLMFKNIDNDVKNEIQAFFESKLGRATSFTFSYPDADDVLYGTEFTVYFKEDSLEVSINEKGFYDLEVVLET